MRNAPVVDAQGRVILHVAGRLIALAETEGKAKIVWEYVTNSRVPGRIVLGPDGNLRLHCSDGFLHCVSTSGRQTWSPAMVGEPLGWACPSVDEEGNTYIHAYEGGLIRVDADGRVGSRRFLAGRQRFDCAGVLQNGVLYTGSEDGYVFAIDVTGPSGKNLWNHAAGQGSVGWFVNTAPAIAQGLLVFAAGDAHLYGFGLDGKPTWKTKMPGQILGAPVVDRHGHVYAGATIGKRGQEPTGALVSIDANSHKIRWQREVDAAIESTPVIGDDDVVYFGDNAGTIHACDLLGHIQWTAKVESAVRSAGAILAPKRLAFGLDNETLVVLECASKAVAQGGWPCLGGPPTCS